MLGEDLRANRRAGLLVKAMIVNLRAGQASRRASGVWGVIALPARLLTALVSRLLSVSFGCSIPFSAKIGRRVRWVHGFHGIFISRRAVIGDDCEILHQVTIGSNYTKAEPERLSPVLGKRVFVGAGAKIIGGVSIGDDARIGANALVVSDVPAGRACVAPAATLLPAKHQREDRGPAG